MRKLTVLVAVAALLASSCGGGASPHRDGARTYYESLDQSSPTAAVETFVDAFARDDFLAVWLSLGRRGA
jgi:hypothetical protein